MAGDIIKSVTVTPVLDTNAYASGDFMGAAILTLSDVAFADQTMLHSITVTDKAKQSLAIDLIFWKTNCSNTTFTDNAALDIHDTDLLQYAGHVSITATNYAALNDNSVATVANIGLVMSLATNSRNLYCTPVARSAPTYAASDLQFTFAFIRP